MDSQNRLKVLFLPARYPSEANPVGGIFIKEHARAASLYNDIVVLYAYPDPSPRPWKLYRVSEDIEEGIRTIRVKYGGLLSYFGRKLRRREESGGSSSNTVGKSPSFLARAFAIPRFIARFIARFIVGDLLYYWSIFATFRRLRMGGWKPDIIHAHIYSAGVPAVILGKLYKIPVVITEHWSVFPRHLLTLLGRAKARFAMNTARIVLPVSDDLRKHIEPYGVKNKFKIVPNTVDTEMFYPPSHQDEGSANKQKNLLLVAGLTPVKGVSYLLEALSQIKEKRHDFVLNIVGDGPNRSEYEELTTKRGLGGIVKFHGLKPKEEVAQFMRNCDFFVLPSLWENFPCVLIEATACGKPVIASDVGGIKEAVNKENGILVTPEDVTALKKAIEYMLENYHDYSSAKIAKYAGERFSYETVGKQLDEVYKMVVGSRYEK